MLESCFCEVYCLPCVNCIIPPLTNAILHPSASDVTRRRQDSLPALISVNDLGNPQPARETTMAKFDPEREGVLQAHKSRHHCRPLRYEARTAVWKLRLIYPTSSALSWRPSCGNPGRRHHGNRSDPALPAAGQSEYSPWSQLQITDVLPTSVVSPRKR